MQLSGDDTYASSRFDAIPECHGQTDRRTEGQTDRRTNGIAMSASRVAYTSECRCEIKCCICRLL